MPSLKPLELGICCLITAATISFCQSKASASLPPTKPRVAIIGGGVASASAAYFLRDLLHNASSPSAGFGIDVFAGEPAAGSLGGRLAVQDFDGRFYESGGSIIHDRNLYMKYFAERVLELQTNYQGDEVRLAVFNGKEALLDTSDWYLVKMAQLLGRYGVSPFVKLRRFVASMLDDFGRIYARQNAGQAFTSVGGLLAAMSDRFPNMTRVSIEKLLLDLEFDPVFVNELVAGAMRSNYGQNVTIHGFVGAVSLAGADGGLWSVRGGNRLVVEGLLDKFSGWEGCRLLRGRRVTRISRDGGGWLVAASSAGGGASDDAGETVERYDRVILTAPGHQAFDIQLDGAAVNRVAYQTTIATFVKGAINYASLGLASRQLRYALLTATPAAPMHFNSLGFQFDVEGRASDDADGAAAVYKVFSERPLTSAQLAGLFSKVDATRSVAWLAYPLYDKPAADVEAASFVLADGLYHTAPIELAASAMEMAALSGRNAALLAYNDLVGLAADRTDPDSRVGGDASSGRKKWPISEERIVELRHTEL